MVISLSWTFVPFPIYNLFTQCGMFIFKFFVLLLTMFVVSYIMFSFIGLLG